MKQIPRYLLFGALVAVVGAATLGYIYAGRTLEPHRSAFSQSVIWVKTPRDQIPLKVEVADTPERWSRGLRGRKSLDENAGMVFVLPSVRDTPVSTAGYKFPISVAFYDANGVILHILEAPPCQTNPCPLYTPGVAYKGALEVNRGWFERTGVREGDILSGDILNR
ncbi:MAG TPA: DUF192 domain-containing protein [Meiothermus sp.]|nr:DUF192 domain-containing protein [Meiothermus sp.]